MAVSRRPSGTGDGPRARTSEEIEEPSVPGGEQDQQGSEQAETPDEPGSELGTEAAMSESDAMPEVSAALLEMHGAVVSALRQTVAQDLAAGQAISQDLDGFGNVQGVGFSPASADSGGLPGETALTLYVAEDMATEDAKRVMADHAGIAAAADDRVPVNIVVTGIIDAQGPLHRSRMRPAPGGVSVGHFAITAGTLGCFARGRNAPRSNRVLMLSNNHVLANSNAGPIGANILQPGHFDGGQNPADRIAILEQFVPINFAGGVNFVDCATGWCWSALVRYPYLMYQSGTSPVFFRVSSVIVACRVGMNVGKTGRTTQLTHGIITDCNATIRVNYGGGRVALFSDQIAIRGIGGAFSAGGDSGSLIWTWDARRNPVGLLFAGGGDFTFANKIGRVLGALDIVIRS
jgi:hypothetical protein